MKKPAKGGRDDSPVDGRTPRKQVTVVTSRGDRQRFLRGMLTHSLVMRGLSFDDAYSLSQIVRSRVATREEVTTAELRDLVDEELGRELGAEVVAGLQPWPKAAHLVRVVYQGHEVPFSRGVLARSVQAAGLDIDRSYEIVSQLETDLRDEGINVLPSGEIARRVDRLLQETAGAGAAGRYLVTRRIRRLPRPLVIYIGGASGTGKSTLALELAPLLRVYRISATDTIRQVMRMVFTPQILPALHRSTFEPTTVVGDAAMAGDPADADDRGVAGYEEQASRVCVGVRAVVERAITENMNIIVEGAHLHPGIVPFPDLEGSVYQVPIFLATLEDEVHRGRFLTRARGSGRRGERYVEHFDSIRAIHDEIIQVAEAQGRAILDTSEGPVPVLGALRLVTGMLERQIPTLTTGGWPGKRPQTPTLLLVIDGVTDRPVRALGGRTPLQAAATPTLDRLAREGRCGLVDAVAPDVVPDTASGTLALLGQSPLALARGPVEAIGAGLRLRPGDVALRGNLATLDEHGVVIDRRAGRIRKEVAKLAEALDEIELSSKDVEGVGLRVAPGTEHRLAVVLQGRGLSAEILGSDPGDAAVPGLATEPRAKDPTDLDAVRTARALAAFESAAREVLERHPANRKRARKSLPVANALLTRGAGEVHRLVPLEESGIPLRMACISGDRTILGLARWLDADTIVTDEMTANLDTDLDLKFARAARALRDHDLVIVHVKGADIAAHDRRPDLKVAFLEKLDRALGNMLEKSGRGLRVAVGSDHATLSESGQHAADPLPVLVWGEGIDADEVDTFDEPSAARGGLGRFPLQALLGKLFNLT